VDRRQQDLVSHPQDTRRSILLTAAARCIVRNVDLEEFCHRPSEYLEGGESLSIERGGRVIGRYVPVPNGNTGDGTGRETAAPANDEESRRAFGRLARAWAEVRAQTGLTEDELAELLDPSKPFPYDDPPRG